MSDAKQTSGNGLWCKQCESHHHPMDACRDGDIYEAVSRRDCPKVVNDKIDEAIANIVKTELENK